MTTGMGHANAAASLMALTFSDKFDLRRTYFMIAGIAGIDPMQGTVGSAAWAKYLVDFGIQWELDAREKPESWPSGYLGINTKSPADKPPLDYKTEVFKLNPDLADAAYALSKNVVLADSPEAQAARAKFSYAPANQPPKVIQCDTLASDTWWSGKYIGERARDWTKLVTDGKGVYCTTQQEDNATYEALSRAASVHRVDLNRAVLRRLSPICIGQVIRWCRRLQRTGLNGATAYRNTNGANLAVYRPSSHERFLRGRAVARTKGLLSVRVFS